MKTLPFAALALACASPMAIPLVAQTPSPTLDSRAQAVVQQRQASFSQAAQQFAAGNTNAGEQAALTGIDQKQGTPGWHEEAGQRLYLVALRLRSARQPAAALNAVNSAIREFDQVVTLAMARNNNVLAARAHEQVAAIQELFFGNIRAASARLQESVRLNPNGKSNQREAERLRQVEADFNRKSPGK